MRGYIKQALRRFAGSALFREIASDLASSQEIQKALLAQYIGMRGLPREKLPTFDEVGFQKYSQFDEDGILLYIFGLIGTTNKKVVEICAGDGFECMAANLIVNHGWRGFLFDGRADDVELAKEFFARRRSLLLSPPVVRTAWIDAETVDDTLRSAGVTGSIDLMSLDIDGMDYWVWKAMDVIKPRVCIFETVNYIPDDKALTVPYDRTFQMAQSGSEYYYRGASTQAFVKLGREKGYRLIGAHRHGFNCVFMQNGVGEEYFPEVTVKSIHENPLIQEGLKTVWPQVKDMPWAEV